MSAAFMAEAPFSLPELVRAEIADDLRTCGCSLAALTVERSLNALTAEAILAEPCGLSVEEWIAEARRERGL